jgi:hypothetical protein
MTTTNEPTNQATEPATEKGHTHQQEEMCCDGQQTAEEHRRNSPDGKCCIDS